MPRCVRERSVWTAYACIPSCLLTYRGKAHSSCSETFYKESLLSEVQNRKDVDPEEKRKVMDMLRRLEDAELEGLGGEDDGEEIEDEVDGDKLRAALQGLDIGTLWDCTYTAEAVVH